MQPMAALSITIAVNPTCGKINVDGSTPRMDTQKTSLRPSRSPIGPPAMVPFATAPKNTNWHICASFVCKAA